MEQKPFRILVLDGGGSKGVYSLGILKELELKLGSPLHNHFQLIYGTSTGSIIAALLGLGHTVPEIIELYLKLIPKIMRASGKKGKSAALKLEAEAVFGDRKFGAFQTDVAIVSTNFDKQIPLIFKSDVQYAHGLKSSFDIGFGCTIAEAVEASCSAYPIFNVKKVHTTNQGTINAVDGGFIANNANLFALVDAHKACGLDEDCIQMLSVGVGHFITKPIGIKYRILGKFQAFKFVEKILNASSNTNELLSRLLFPQLKIVRISETYNEPEYGTNMIETNEKKLNKLLQLGRDSYGKFETDIDQLFQI